MQTSSPRRALRPAAAPLIALLLCVAGSGAGLASAQAAAPSPATTPTTTYVPSGGTAVPGAATPATPSTATTTPAVSIPATPSVQTTPAPTTAPAQTPAAGTAKAGKASRGDRPLSTGAIVIAALAALLLLGILGWALARRRAFEPHWLLALRHAMAEAGFRASATWSEFADWARLGH
jgi:hypothetical protein